jgi:pyrroline-5-carboxylate reductase
MLQLAIIGGGFMGAALAQGLVDSGWKRESIVIAEVREARRHFLDELKIPCVGDARDAAKDVPTVLFAVKPQDFGAAMALVAPVFTPGKLAISIAAGVKIASMESALKCAVIRCMPNTPAAIGAGVTALARGKHATDAHLMTALNILSAVGKTIIVDEHQMDAVTAVSGTGPAYVFYLAEALIDAAMAEGLSREQAYALTYQTFVGASQLLQHDPAGPAELRKRVTSPNGTTHAAITHLQSKGWAETFIEAVHKAKARSEELGR